MTASTTRAARATPGRRRRASAPAGSRPGAAGDAGRLPRFLDAVGAVPGQPVARFGGSEALGRSREGGEQQIRRLRQKASGAGASVMPRRVAARRSPQDLEEAALLVEARMLHGAEVVARDDADHVPLAADRQVRKPQLSSRRSASIADCRGERVTGSAVITFRTLVWRASNPSARQRTASRPVKMPRRRPPAR